MFRVEHKIQPLNCGFVGEGVGSQQNRCPRYHPLRIAPCMKPLPECTRIGDSHSVSSGCRKQPVLVCALLAARNGPPDSREIGVSRVIAHNQCGIECSSLRKRLHVAIEVESFGVLPACWALSKRR